MTFGNTSIDPGLIAILSLFLALKLLSLIVVIWFVVQGFRVHWGWGVANLLIPGAVIPFSIFHFKEAKKPLILLGIGLGIFLVISAYARLGNHTYHARPKVGLSPNVPASAAHAVLYLNLVSYDGTNTTSISGSVSLKRPAMPEDHDHGRKIEEQLIAIGTDGFFVRFAGENQTNFILFHFDQTTETNMTGWHISGNYSQRYNDYMMSRPRMMLKPANDNALQLLTTNGVTTPLIGSGSNTNH